MAKRLITTTAVGLLLLFLFAFAGTDIVRAEAANAMWMEPSILAFNTNETLVGHKFNVTMWVNITDNSFTWQCHITFNATHLKATKTGYTAGSTSEWATYRTGGGTMPVTPTLNNIVGFVEHGETCLGMEYVPGPVTATLIWVEFEIIQAPPPTVGSNLTTDLAFDNTDTFILDDTLADITYTTHPADYSYMYVTDSTPPTIDDPIQDPPSAVQPDQEVMVSVNVTDVGSWVENVTLYYTNDTQTYLTPMMLNETTGLWETLIPGHDIDTRINYSIKAYDYAGNMEENNNAGEYFTFTIVPEFTMIMLFALMVTTTLATVVARKKLKW